MTNEAMHHVFIGKLALLCGTITVIDMKVMIKRTIWLVLAMIIMITSTAFTNRQEKMISEICGNIRERIMDFLFEVDMSPRLYEPSDFQLMGVLNWNDWRWTWYSQRVLTGGGLSIPGRYVDDDGYVCDENDYICLASCFLDKGTVIDTPLGKQGCVYDYCATANTIDVYVDW